MNPSLMKAIIDLAAFLSLSEDDVVNEDSALFQLEQLAATLHQLSDTERQVFVDYIQQVASAERVSASQERIEFLENLAENLGVITG
jgi:hypothetical protein